MTARDWETSAACAQTDPDLWHPRKGATGRAATWICNRRCPVRQECLEAALDEELGLGPDSRHGIRGGLSGRGRWRLQQQRDQQAAA